MLSNVCIRLFNRTHILLNQVIQCILCNTLWTDHRLIERIIFLIVVIAFALLFMHSNLPIKSFYAGYYFEMVILYINGYGKQQNIFPRSSLSTYMYNAISMHIVFNLEIQTEKLILPH